MGDLQLFDPLDPATEAALRHSIRRFGVIVPVVVDQRGRTLDGHHRKRIAAELGLRVQQTVRRVRSDDEAQELARTLNEDRRHLDRGVRLPVVADLRQEGHSERAIAGALGVSKTQVRRDIDQLVRGDQLKQPEMVRGIDGKDRSAVRPAPIRRSESPAPSPDEVPTPERLMEPTDDERLYGNYLAVKERFSRVLHELLDLDAERVGSVLLTLGHEEVWRLIDSTLTRDLLDIDSWFRAVVAVKPKPFTVVQGGA